MSPETLEALVKVVLIDLTLVFDNVALIAVIASEVPQKIRAKIIFLGVFAAAAMRIIFALLTNTLLHIPGLLFAGGAILLVIGIKMARETIREMQAEASHRHVYTGIKGAIIAIILGDLSLSLDNVLAVAGAAYEAPMVLIFGLFLSVILMGFGALAASSVIAKYKKLALVGAAIIVIVSVDLMHSGLPEVIDLFSTLTA